MPSRLSDTFRAHPVHLHHNQLDLESVKELPDSHTWPPLDDHPSGDLFGAESVPVIDLTDPNLVDLMGQASESWGAFQITNHGIPISLLQEVESQGHRLFSLPAQQKLKAARSPDGVSGYGLARISAFFPKLMWSEGFTIVGSPLDHARQLWPDQEHSKFCEVVDEYQKEMKKLAERLMWTILASLGITKEEINWADPKGDIGGSAALQLNSYPACPDPNRAMGLAAHTDSTLLTILYQNNTSGLQVLKDGVGWVTVPPTPGALVVNVGDLLHILSNGRYPSVLHRAAVNRTHHRLSVAYLFGPPTNAQISPLSRLVDSNHPPLYRSVTWSEYLGTKAKHFNKALSSVSLCTRRKGFIDVNDYNRVKVG